jgi:osmotically-inducible protein OsmY
MSVNGLAVGPSQADNDDEITDAVRLVLDKDRFVPAEQIRVRTHQRVVMLEGVVSSDSLKEMAAFDAWYILGVDEVDNQPAVQP